MAVYVFMVGLLFLIGMIIYLGIRCMSGKFCNTGTFELLLWTSCVVSLCFIPWADLIDTMALIVYVVIVVVVRLFVCNRPFRESGVAFHMAMLYLSLSRLDKVTGYGHPNEYLVLVQYLFLIAIVLSCIYLVFKPRRFLAIGALFLLIFPISHFPHELARNLLARRVFPNVEHLYVTKMYADEIYGLRFDKEDCVENYVLIEGNFQKKDSNLLHDGSGTLAAQIPVVHSMEFNIVKKLFGG